MKKTHKILLSVLLFIGGCATTQDAEKNTIATDDPYEYFNRKMFSFNDKVDDRCKQVFIIFLIILKTLM